MLEKKIEGLGTLTANFSLQTYSTFLIFLEFASQWQSNARITFTYLIELDP